MESILTSVKSQLGVEESYEHFDDELIIFINSVLAEIIQLGVGPEAGFTVHDATETWHDFIGDEPRLNSVKTLVYLRVKKVFDPPQSSIVMAAIDGMIEESTWRVTHTAAELKEENERRNQNE